MKKRKTLTRLLCATVSVATVATLGGMALADETEAVEVEETEIVEEQPDAEEAEVIADETEAEETEAEETEAPAEEASEEEEIIEEVEVTEDEVIADVIADEEVADLETVEPADEVITVEEETIIFEEAAAGKNGWVHDDYGNWYYYIDDVKQYGWLTVGGKTYYLDDYDGHMVVGSRVIDSKYYIFGSNGAMLTGWVNYLYEWYYCTANGAETGWNKHGKNWYFFADATNWDGPYMYWGTIQSIGDYSYAFDGNGVMLTGWCQPYLYEDDEDWYYCDSSGHLQTGWQKIGGKWYYLDAEMYTGFCEIYNSETESYEDYYFNDNGVMQTGWVSSECPFGTGTYWYYFESSGKAAEGWKKLSKKWYYFRNGMAATGMTYVEGQYYYFGLPLKEDGSANPNVGVMQTGWISEQVMDYYGVETAWYYFNANGSMATGWKKIGSNWYYFYEDSGLKGYNRTGRMVTGIYRVYNESTESSDYYFFSANGVMQTNHWVKDEGYWYYFGSNGIQAEGWQQINGKWYYLDPDMWLGLHFINGVLYDFGTDGVCVNPPANPTNPIVVPKG